jgi:hypothetical protein
MDGKTSVGIPTTGGQAEVSLGRAALDSRPNPQQLSGWQLIAKNPAIVGKATSLPRSYASLLGRYAAASEFEKRAVGFGSPGVRTNAISVSGIVLRDFLEAFEKSA